MNSDNPSNKNEERSGSERLEQTSEELAQAILKVIESGSSKFWEGSLHARPKNRFADTLTFFASIWVVLFATFSAILITVGWFAFGVSPLHSVQRIAHEQSQNERESIQTEHQIQSSNYHVDLGNDLLSAGQAKAAAAEFEKALEKDPTNVEAEKGTLKSELFVSIEEDDYDPGITQKKLFKLQEEYPNDTHVWAFTGHAFSHYNYDVALENYDKAIELDESNAHAFAGKGTVHFFQGDYDKHLEVAKKTYDLAAWNPRYQNNYAYALFLTNKYEDAIREYEGVTAWDWRYAAPYVLLAHLYRLTGDLESSRWAYETHINLLEDEEVMALQKNKGMHGYSTGSDSYPVFLAETADSKYYAYYGMALTSYLLGNAAEAEQYADKAEDLQINAMVEAEIKRLIEHDLKNLREEQDGFSNKIDEFNDRFI